MSITTEETHSVINFSAETTGLKQCLETSPFGVAILDRVSNKRLFVNSSFAKIFGYENAEAMLDLSIEYTWVDHAQMRTALDKFKTGQIFEGFVCERRRRNGSTFWVLLHGQPVTFEGRPAGIFWHSDITAQKELEQSAFESDARFRAIFDNTVVGMALQNEEGRRVLVNDAFVRILNRPREEIEESHVSDFTHPEDQWINNQAKEAVMREDGARQILQKRFVDQNDHEIWVDAAVTPLPTEEEAGKLALSQITDITEARHSERRLIEAKEHAERANRAKSNFLASMSHELRTPLNAVLGFAQFLKMDPTTPLTDKQHDYVDTILSGGNHLLDLINEILDLARIESNKENFSFEPTNANAVVQECIALTRVIANDAKITLIDEFSDGQAVDLYTDAIRFKQIILNLLGNAVKYNNPGGQVIIRSGGTINGFLKLEIEDSGIGIAEEDQSGLFEMFNRVNATIAKTTEGTGIGLHVSKSLVELLAGEIGFQSTFGEGSQFWVELPLWSNKRTLVWSDQFTSGVQILDDDHRQIMVLLNAMTRRGQDGEGLDRILTEMLRFIPRHLRREEQVLSALERPELASHQEYNRTMLKRLEAFKTDWLATQELDLVRRLHLNLRVWWLDHFREIGDMFRNLPSDQEVKINAIVENLNRQD